MELLTLKRCTSTTWKIPYREKAYRRIFTKRRFSFSYVSTYRAPCNPVVKKGDRVLVGQVIGEATGFVSAPIHSSVSGTVKILLQY